MNDLHDHTTTPQDSDQIQNLESDPSFKSLGLNQKVLRGIKQAGFTLPTPIQMQAIPPIMERRDVIAQAQTGTGKTAAFALPILHNLKNDSSIEALVITPTRELAIQISDEVFKLGKFLKTKTVCVYGGQSIKKQIDLIERHPPVMVATPGRLLDHLTNERLKNFNPRIVVLDECDEMLDRGFIDDIEEIFGFIPNDAQTLLFSATLPPRIQELAKKILFEPVHIKIDSKTAANEDIAQRYYIINDNERREALVRLIDTESPHKSLVFTRTRREADEVNEFLQGRGHKSVSLHGDMTQILRREALGAFRSGAADILVATDVAARGLDIGGISHVFNYHMPLNTESYVHRIGRTGRAGNKGIALTLANPLEYKELKRMQSSTEQSLQLYEIPGASNDSTVDEIIGAKVSDEALSLYESMKDRIDTTQLALKLLSLHLRRTVKIGLSKHEVDNLQDENPSPATKKPKSDQGRATKDGHKGARGGRQGGAKKPGVNELKRQKKLQSQQKYYKG